MLDAQGDLAAAVIAFFSPAFCVAIFVVLRHGFNKNAGWLYLVILSLLRIIGAAVELYIETSGKPTKGLVSCVAITSSIGTAPLLLVLMGVLQRIYQGMAHQNQKLSTIGFRILGLAGLAALIVSVLAGTDEASSNPDTAKKGKTELEAAAIIFLTIYLALVAYTLHALRNSDRVLTSEKKLLQACLLALPFLGVRIIYTVLVAFAAKGSIFYIWNVDIWVSAFMKFVMEAIVVSLFICAGLMTPKAERKALLPSEDQELQRQQMKLGD